MVNIVTFEYKLKKCILKYDTLKLMSKHKIVFKNNIYWLSLIDKQ